ncbi:MAG: anti-sigma factor [Acidimicrobiales bacterium]
MTSLNHEAAADLLGAYALDAVEPEEAALIEAHLQRCGRCSTELASFREVIGLVANSGGDAPGHLWNAISARIERPLADQERPVVRHISTSGAPSPIGIARGKGPRMTPWILGAAAAAFVVIAALGVQVGRLDHRVSQLQALSDQQAITEAAQNALSDPQARHVSLDAAHSSGPVVVELAVLPSGTSFLVNRGLPALPADETYQLWGQVGDQLVSLGVLGPAPNDESFHLDPSASVSSFAVTAERAGGVVRTTHVPVAVSSPIS